MASSLQSVVATIVIALVASLSAVFLNFRVSSDAEQVEHTLVVKRVLAELMIDAQDIEIGQRGFIITNQESYLTPFESAKERIFHTHERLTKLVVDNPEQAKVVALLGALVRDRIAISDRSVALMKSGQASEAADVVREGHGKALMDRIRQLIADANSVEERLLETRNATHRWRQNALLAALTTILVLSGVAAVMAQRREAERIQVVDAANRALSSTNEALEQRVAERTAELGVERDRAEALLRDVTHRVGNALTLVVGFLNLQIKHAVDPEAKKTLAAARERVFAIASAQRRINVVHDLELVRIDDLLSGVLADLKATQSESNIEIKVSVPPLLMQAQSATTICVLCQEFVINAVKHAFAPGDAGVIDVSLERVAPSGAVMRIADTGRGFTSDDGIQRSGLGLTIAERMARQFEGRIEFGSRDGEGTAVTITLPNLVLTEANTDVLVPAA